MTYINDRGYICYSRNTQDGHGGRAEEHRAEMREIALEEIQKAIPQIQQDAYNQAVSNLLAALKMDIETVVNIALDTGEEIFHDKRTKQALLQTLIKSVKQSLVFANLLTHLLN